MCQAAHSCGCWAGRGLLCGESVPLGVEPGMRGPPERGQEVLAPLNAADRGCGRSPGSVRGPAAPLLPLGVPRPCQKSYSCPELSRAVSAVRCERSCEPSCSSSACLAPAAPGQAPAFLETAGPSAPCSAPCHPTPGPQHTRLHQPPASPSRTSIRSRGRLPTTLGRPRCPLAPIPMPTTVRAVGLGLLCL